MVVPLGYKMEIGSVCLSVCKFLCVSHAQPPNVWSSGGLVLWEYLFLPGLTHTHTDTHVL